MENKTTAADAKAEYRRLTALAEQMKQDTPNARDFRTWDEAMAARQEHAEKLRVVFAERAQVVADYRAGETS